MQKEIKVFHEFKMSVQSQIVGIEKVVKNNIFHTNSNGTGNKDEITASYCRPRGPTTTSKRNALVLRNYT